MKSTAGIFRNSRIFTSLSILLALIMIFSLLPNEILAQNLHFNSGNPTVTTQQAESLSPDASETLPPADTHDHKSPLGPPQGKNKLSDRLDKEGKFLDYITAYSSDKKAVLTIPAGAQSLTADGKPLTEIILARLTKLPGTPQDKSQFIGLIYELGPEGLSFDSPVTLTLTFNPSQIASGAKPGDLSIAYFDKEKSNWINLQGKVDLENKTISADIGQPGPYTILAPYKPENIPTPKPRPTPTPVIGNSSASLKVSAEVSPNKDNEIISSTGKIQVKIPKGAVSEPLDIEMTELPPPPGTGIKMVHYFKLEASNKSMAKVSSFNKELEISIQNSPEELKGLDPDSALFCYYDEKEKSWVPLPNNRFDKDNYTLTATTDHFSYFGEQLNVLVNYPGRVMAGEVDLQSGSSVFSYPLELPPGPGGFQPSLSLTYSSSVLDETKSKRTSASWVGLGWNLSVGKAME
jgi:hypothetical protein